jgi:hypothetical protein
MERKTCNDTLKQLVIINGGILHVNSIMGSIAKQLFTLTNPLTMKVHVFQHSFMSKFQLNN